MTADHLPEVDLRALAPGTHLIDLYRNEAESARAAMAFVVAGLEAGDRVLYLADDRRLPAMSAWLRAGDATTRAAIVAGQLAACRFSDVYGEWDPSEPAAVADGIRAAAAQARERGFPGLRIAAELGDRSRVPVPIEQVLAWERLTSRLQGEEGVTSVCQYDRQRFTSAHQQLLAAEHAGAAPGSMAPPLACFLATPRGLRITGELDKLNQDECLRVVEARLTTGLPLVIDASGVTFLDVSTLRGWYALAEGLPDGGNITLADPSPPVRSMVGLLGWRHPRLRFDPPVRSSAPGTEVM